MVFIAPVYGSIAVTIPPKSFRFHQEQPASARLGEPGWFAWTLLLQIGTPSKPHPFLGLGQPVFHLFPGSSSALLAHELEIAKLAFRIHRPLRYEETPTLPAFRQRQTKESFIQSDETVARHFRRGDREGAPFGDAFSDAQQVVVSRLRDDRRRIIVRPARE
jgi:hypothetical protein